MPYVTVWIDPDEACEDCRALDDLRGAVAEALKLARDGDVLGVVRVLSAAQPDSTAMRERDKERELAKLYEDWLLCPMPRPDFLTFAHKRRKHSAV